MKRIVSITAVACLLLTVAFCVGAAPTDSIDPSADVEALKEQLSSLQECVRAIEKCLEEAELIVSRILSRDEDCRCVIPPTLYSPRCLPKGSQQRQFNGIIYYLVPLDQDSQAPSPLTK